MAVWVATTTEGYVNLETATSVYPDYDYGVSGWRAKCNGTWVGVGPFATSALANDAIRQLVGGVSANDLL